MRGGGGLNARCIVIYSSDYPQRKNKVLFKSILDRNPNGIMRWYTVYWDEYNFLKIQVKTNSIERLIWFVK